MLRYTVLLILVWSLLGCYWPPPSNGGYAAHYLFDLRHFQCSDRLSICQIQKDRLGNAIHELNVIRNTHAVRCHPARYTELRLLQQQIAQEIAAKLYLSAQLDLNLFDMNLIQLNRLNTFKECRRVINDRGWESLKLRIQ